MTHVNHIRWSLALTIVSVAITLGAAAIDSDVDSINDALDNCQLIANSNQRDTDGDGFGNHCDGDYNNDGIVNAADLGLFRTVFFSTRPHANALGEAADMNDDGVVNVADLGLLRRGFLLPPGPAGGGPLTANDAARFLAQTTYGPRPIEIVFLTASADLNGWIDSQMALPTTRHNPLARNYATRMCFDMPVIDAWYQDARMAAWWDITLNAPDQLRQRVAFALSQILVVGDRSEILANSQFAMADYYDTLADGAFGNYRELLERVTLHSAMGVFLSSVRNERAQPALNIRPDENFAREIMQLFTIGVQQLDIDGSAVLDDNGAPVPTYSQADIEEFARVYTGWNYAGIGWYDWHGFSDFTQPMQAVESFHDDDAKVLFGVPVAAGQTAQQDLDAALDILFAHPNVGPFVASRLIKRLTTSNPSSGYVERVARAFNDNGAGVRGDLAAVIRTLLLDPEARSGHVFIPQQFGKMREPMLRMSHIRRSFNAQPPQYVGYIYDRNVQCGQPAYNFYGTPFGRLSQTLAQQPLSSPSVFNFYLPDYAPPGHIRDAGLVAPEFEIMSANTMQSASLVISFEIHNRGEWGPDWLGLDLSYAESIADDHDALLDHLNLVMLSGQMSAGVRVRLLLHLANNVFPAGEDGRAVKARDAIMLIANSPEYLIQK